MPGRIKKLAWIVIDFLTLPWYELKIDPERINEQDRRDRRRTLDDNAGYRAKVALRILHGYTHHHLATLPEKGIVFIGEFQEERKRLEWLASRQAAYNEALARKLAHQSTPTSVIKFRRGTEGMTNGKTSGIPPTESQRRSMETK